MSRLRQFNAGWIVACALALTLVGCHQGPSPATPEATSATAQLANRPSRNKPRAAGQAPARPAPTPTRSFALLMRALPAPQQVQVRAWYRRMGGPPMDDATPAHIAWMQARHYPMPKDIARASSMSTAELKNAAGTGNTTARILYVARQLHNFGEHTAQRSSYTRWDTSALPDIILTMRQVLGSGSPFAGYLYAAKARLMYPDSEERIASARLAGLVWASEFGDTRATLLLNDPKIQAVNATMASTEMSSMLTAALRNNPQLFSAPPIPIPTTGH